VFGLNSGHATEDESAYFSVSATSPVTAVVGLFVQNTNLTLKPNWSTAKKTASTDSNPFTTPTNDRETWFRASATAGDLYRGKYKIFLAVDPASVTQETNLTVTAFEGTQEGQNDPIFSPTKIASSTITLYPEATDPQPSSEELKITTTNTNEQNEAVIDEYDTLEAALAADTTGVATQISVPVASSIAGGRTVPANSTVEVKAVRTCGDNVTAKEVLINDTVTVYVIKNAENVVSIEGTNLSITTSGSNISGSGDNISAYIDVTQMLANVSAEGSIAFDSSTTMKLFLEKNFTATGRPFGLPEALSDKTLVIETEMHPVIQFINASNELIGTYDVSDCLAEGAKFDVALQFSSSTTQTTIPSGDSTETIDVNNKLKPYTNYTIYHYRNNNGSAELIGEPIVATTDENGKIPLTITNFSYFLGFENAPAEPEPYNIDDPFKTNYVHRTYMNLQTNLFLNYQLYLTNDTSLADYAQNGKLQLNYNGRSYEVDLQSVGVFSDLAMRIGVATNSFYCGRYYDEKGATNWYYVCFGVFPNKMDAACSMKIIKSDGSVATVYENTNPGATVKSEVSLQTVENNNFVKTVNQFEDSMIAATAEGTLDHQIAQILKSYGVLAAQKYS
jgi:hypothetical protein